MSLFIATTIGLAIALGLSSLGGLFSERSGIINIGIEGMMSIGALTWAIMGVQLKSIGNSSQILSFVLAGLLGSIIALFHGFVSITLRGNQIISGTAINMLIAGISLFIINAFQIGSRVGSITSEYSIMGFASGGLGSQISILIIPTIIIFVLGWWILKKTTWGLRLRTVGENPITAESVGINVNLKRYQALIVSGFLSGMGGAFFVQYSGGTFYGGVQGYGFLALGILIFGQWKVHFVGLATILFSSLTSFALIGQNVFQITWLQQIPLDILQTLPFILSILIMIFTSKTMSIPNALGIPYQKKKN